MTELMTGLPEIWDNAYVQVVLVETFKELNNDKTFVVFVTTNLDKNWTCERRFLTGFRHFLCVG